MKKSLPLILCFVLFHASLGGANLNPPQFFAIHDEPDLLSQNENLDDWETAGEIPEEEEAEDTPFQQEQQELPKPPETPPPQQDPQPVPTKEEPQTAKENPFEEENANDPDIPDEEPDLDKFVHINFTNVDAIELLRYISQVANKNFIFDAEDLQFPVTIISEEETTIENIMAALIQELRIHGLSIIEKGNNLIIHQTPGVRGISRISAGEFEDNNQTEFVTQVFRLNTLNPESAALIIRPLVSNEALVEVLEGSNNLIVTDIVSNVSSIAELIKSMDAPKSGLIIGQYVARSMLIDVLARLAQQVMQPISQTQTLTLVPHNGTNSIFIVSTPFLVEKTISVMQHLDQTEGVTRIYGLDELKIEDFLSTEEVPKPKEGQWELEDGKWIFRAPGEPDETTPPEGTWMIDENGNWIFVPKGTKPTVPLRPPTDIERPDGEWTQTPEGGDWTFQLFPGKGISAELLTRPTRLEPDLPLGHIERTQFFIHKLQYRRGEDIQEALNNIGYSLSQVGTANEDLVATISSVQWIEGANSLVFTGTPRSIDKVRELIEEIDVPLRQVFIEMLVLETTLDDSLNYGVNPGARFGGGSEAGAESFLSGSSVLNEGLDTAGVRDGEVLLPDAFKIAENSNISSTQGFQLGIIGQNIKCGGLTFNTLGALVNALHTREEVNIIMSPKILAEDGIPAEIFVGINTRFQDQTINNAAGQPISTNFEFRDVGTLLQVTPFLGNGDIITLEINQEISRAPLSGAGGGDLSATDPGATTTTQNRTKTRFHVPDSYFLVISGMMQDEKRQQRTQVPCLGGVPILGAGFSDKQLRDQKRNTMIFMRPRIVDTVEDIQNLTKHQQDIWDNKHRSKKMWNYETDEALDFFNISPSDEDTFGNREFY